MKATKKGPGRPAFEEGTARTVLLAVRVSEEERATIERAAAHADKLLSQWVRETLLAAAGQP